MDDSLVLLLVIGGIGLVIALVVGIIVLVKKYEKKRIEDLAALAAEMSLHFYADGDPALESLLSHFSLMQQGHSRRLRNLIRGDTQSVDLSLFDYSFTTGHGKHQHHHSYSIAVFQSPHLDLPSFQLTPENIFHKIGSAFGYQDIDFAGYETFSRKYLLRGPNETAIRRLFTEDVVQFFEAELAQKRRFSIFGERSMLMVATSRQNPKQIQTFMQQAFANYGTFKVPEALEEAPADVSEG